jgi:hypothetical protein
MKLLRNLTLLVTLLGAGCVSSFRKGDESISYFRIPGIFYSVTEKNFRDDNSNEVISASEGSAGLFGMSAREYGERMTLERKFDFSYFGALSIQNYDGGIFPSESVVESFDIPRNAGAGEGFEKIEDLAYDFALDISENNPGRYDVGSLENFGEESERQEARKREEKKRVRIENNNRVIENLGNNLGIFLRGLGRIKLW